MTEPDAHAVAQQYISTVIETEQQLGYTSRVPDDVYARASRELAAAIRDLSQAVAKEARDAHSRE